jgi:hypothetical protein
MHGDDQRITEHVHVRDSLEIGLHEGWGLTTILDFYKATSVEVNARGPEVEASAIVEIMEGPVDVAVVDDTLRYIRDHLSEAVNTRELELSVVRNLYEQVPAYSTDNGAHLTEGEKEDLLKRANLLLMTLETSTVIPPQIAEEYVEGLLHNLRSGFYAYDQPNYVYGANSFRLIEGEEPEKLVLSSVALGIRILKESSAPDPEGSIDRYDKYHRHAKRTHQLGERGHELASMACLGALDYVEHVATSELKPSVTASRASRQSKDRLYAKVAGLIELANSPEVVARGIEILLDSQPSANQDEGSGQREDVIGLAHDNAIPLLASKDGIRLIYRIYDIEPGPQPNTALDARRSDVLRELMDQFLEARASFMRERRAKPGITVDLLLRASNALKVALNTTLDFRYKD